MLSLVLVVFILSLALIRLYLSLRAVERRLEALITVLDGYGPAVSERIEASGTWVSVPERWVDLDQPEYPNG